ncbi:MAG: 3-methyl-2-oxobutanoate dehydrogenase subunit VorB [Chloroflexi bacterium HGW-Chloroflexi-10]|nr:MAG: 3-methyl-2-oxobutanoate dehydrogenase subunit VorB [Chloroflexi bacterium HGW-Chloroflexi-10]
MAKELLKGNVAIAEAAVRAGLNAYFGYPITPQTELLEWLSARMPELGRAFVQAESELGAINMVYGAACTGARVMTSSSSPGFSLMLEGISYIAGTEIPVVLVDVMRGGPGLGNIAPAQADYNQIVHGGGHGDYHPIVLAPANIQEAIDITYTAFDLAEKYRNLVIIMVDGSLGQMMEPAELPEMKPVIMRTPEWAVYGSEGRERRFLSSIYLDPPAEEITNFRLERRWQEIKANEVQYKEYYLDDAEYAVIGFGTSGRIALSAVRAARAKGIPVGLLRPVSLAPFPEKAVEELSKKVKGMLVVEMNAGQMLEDIIKYSQGRIPVEFYGRMGGMVPMPEEIEAEIQRLVSQPAPTNGHPRDRWLARFGKVN